MNKYKIIFFSENIILIALAIVAFMSSGNQRRRSVSSEELALKEVQVFSAQPKAIQTYIAVHGRVEASNAISVAAEANGKIERGNVDLKAGTNFKKGQVLFSIDNDQAEMALLGRRSAFLNTLSSILSDLKIDYKDEFEEWNEFYLSIEIKKSLPKMPEIGSSKLKTFLIRKNIINEYYTIQAEEDRLSKFKVVAPFDGAITNTFKEIGDFAGAGAQVARIIRTNEVEVNVSVDAKDRNWVKLHDEVTFYADDTKDTYQGKVVRIGDVINPNTQSIDVYVNIKSIDKQLFEGMYVTGEIKAKQIENAIDVSNSALVKGKNIYVVNDTGLVLEHAISIDKAYKTNAVITGVEQGMQIVLDGNDEVSVGEKVETYTIED